MYLTLAPATGALFIYVIVGFLLISFIIIKLCFTICFSVNAGDRPSIMQIHQRVSVQTLGTEKQKGPSLTSCNRTPGALAREPAAAPVPRLLLRDLAVPFA